MSSPRPRETWIDTLRAGCVVFMIEVHLLDAWLAPGLAHGLAYNTLRFLGGFAAPGFLFLAGLGLAKRDASLAARGASLAARRREGLRRGAYVLGIAYTFRVVEYVLGRAFVDPSAWAGIFKVDILNVIGVASMLVALALVQRSAARAAVTLGALLVGVVVAFPLLAAQPRALLGGYLYAHDGGFAVVNWAGFALAGALFGMLLERGPRSLHVAALGAAVLGAGVACEALPPFFAVQDFWRSSPEWFIQRLGWLVLAAGVLRGLAERGGVGARGGVLALLGRHSLMAYMVSVDLTYGGLARPMKHQLPLWGVLASAVVMTALVTGVAWVMERRGRARLAAPALAVTRRAS